LSLSVRRLPLGRRRCSTPRGCATSGGLAPSRGQAAAVFCGSSLRDFGGLVRGGRTRRCSTPRGCATSADLLPREGRRRRFSAARRCATSCLNVVEKVLREELVRAQDHAHPASTSAAVFPSATSNNLLRLSSTTLVTNRRLVGARRLVGGRRFAERFRFAEPFRRIVVQVPASNALPARTRYQ